MVRIIWSMDDLYNLVKKWQDSEFDGIIVFDGNRGISKSTGAFKLCSKFDEFKPKRDIVFSRDDFMKQLSEKRKGVILADEVINILFNREFFLADQNKTIKMLNMYRDHCNLIVCCVPNFYDLDKQFRNLVKVRINVVRRGYGIIHSKNHSAYSTDKWDTTINEKIEKSWMKNNTFKPRYDRLTTYRGIIEYGKLSEKQELIYKKIKDEKRGRLLEEENKNKPANQWDDLYNKYKEGILTKDKLSIWCDIQGLKLHNVMSNLQIRARNEGTTLKKLEENLKLKVVSDNAILKSIQTNDSNSNNINIVNNNYNNKQIKRFNII